MAYRLKKAWLVVAAVALVAIGTTYAMKRTAQFPQLAVVSDGAVQRPPGATLEVTYIANQGVLLAAGSTQVLVDGLHRPYRSAYPVLPDAHREQIETARPPFNDVDVVLVSHAHLDHFHAEAVVRHLRHNATATLVSSQQVVDELQKVPDFTSVKSRVTAMTPGVKERVTIAAGGVNVELLGIGHGTGRHQAVQNLGHLLTLGGKRLLHIGDASTEDASIFDALNLDTANIDIAVLPVWFLTSDDGASIVREHIKPRRIIAVHMPASDSERASAQIKDRFPDARPFTLLLDKAFY